MDVVGCGENFVVGGFGDGHGFGNDFAAEELGEFGVVVLVVFGKEEFVDDVVCDD